MDRLTKYLNKLIDKATSYLKYSGHYPYTVVSCNPQLQTLEARSQLKGWPDLTGVPLGAPGLALNPPPGSEVRIGFTGMDSTKPYVASYSSGGLAPVIPNSGSGVLNEIDAGYLLIVFVPGVAPAPGNPLPSAMTAFYFPAGVAGSTQAQAAYLIANVPPASQATLLHLNQGRVLPNAWTVP